MTGRICCRYTVSGHQGARVPDQAGDLLDRHAVIRRQRDEAKLGDLAAPGVAAGANEGISQEF